MPTFNDNLTAIRLLLDHPDTNRPGMDVLFQHLTDQVQHHHNQLQNSSAHWSVQSFLLTTSAGNEDYLISADNFGKPFYVYTTDMTGDVSFVRREVPFVLLQNIDQFYWGVQQVQMTDQHTVQFISFYRSAGAWYARVTPIPNGSMTYTVFYETADIPAPSLGATEGISCFNHLIRAQTALAALPHCGWGEVHSLAKGENGTIWQRKVENLAAALRQNEMKYQAQFSTYIGTLMQAGVEGRDPFGDEGGMFWWGNTPNW